MKYRIYRLRACWEYQDIQADSPEIAECHFNDPRNDFKPIDDGLILSYWTDTDTDHVKFYKQAQLEMRKALNV